MSAHHRPVPIERLFDGLPLIAPTDHPWESGVTFNASAILVEPSHAEAYDALVGQGGAEKYPDGIVAVHYRARPKEDPGFPWTRSFVGLAVYTPDLQLIKRFDEPVISPGEAADSCDNLGVEDPRVTFLDGWFWIVYCGVRSIEHPDPLRRWLGSVSMAKSKDLVHWEKVGAVIGTGDAFAGSSEPDNPEMRVSNKDGVLMPHRIGGKFFLLHRPMRGEMGAFATCLAMADSPEGPYIDLGFLNGAVHHDRFVSSWCGAGGVPIEIGKDRYLSIAHTGNYLPGYKREYVLDAHLYDFSNLNIYDPHEVVTARFDGFMGPQTDFEINGPFPDSVANVVFSCGNYLHDGWVYIVYGGGDSFTLAARVRLQDLVCELEEIEE